jgi:hypothetical protein
MIVQVNSCSEQKEWCCLEFQGEILSEGHEKLGNLSLNGNDATLLLDHQILQGRVQKLEKPLVITSDTESNTLEIVAVVQKKIIFNSRPQPRMS